MNLGGAQVDITGNNLPLKAKLAESKREVETFGTQVAKMAAPMIGLGAVTALAGGIAAGVKGAGSLAETMSKVDVVFGNSAGSVKAFGAEMNATFGSQRGALLDAAAGIGLIGKASGLAQPEAAKMAVTLARLADDASSFYDVSLEEALLKIKAGLVGEAEPIRSFGVLLSEAAVKNEAFAMGIARAGKDLNESQKVQARYSLILKGLKDATGDHMRTQESFNNQLKEAQGRLVTLAETIGSAVIPMFNQMLKAINPVVDGLTKTIDYSVKMATFQKQSSDPFKGNAIANWTSRTLRGLMGPSPQSMNPEPLATGMNAPLASTVNDQEIAAFRSRAESLNFSRTMGLLLGTGKGTPGRTIAGLLGAAQGYVGQQVQGAVNLGATVAGRVRSGYDAAQHPMTYGVSDSEGAYKSLIADALNGSKEKQERALKAAETTADVLQTIKELLDPAKTLGRKAVGVFGGAK